MASVQAHKDRWRVKWYDETGRQLYESHATEEAAKRAARKIEARAVLDEKPPMASDPDALTLARWWDRWEPGRQWRASTRATHNSHWRRYLSPVFGRMPISQITTADVRRWHRKLEARGLAPTTVSGVNRTLSMVLQGAVEDELIARNPAAAARLKRPAKTPPVALDPTMLTQLLGAIDQTTPALSTFARVVAVTGLRRSEAAGLTWDRVDLDAGELTIDRQFDYAAPHRPAWCPTKTGESRRVLLTPAAVAMLRAHRKAQPVIAIKDALVFTRGDGSTWTRSDWRDAWQRAKTALAKAGTPLPAGAKGWHSLRHTVASRLTEAGVPPAEAAEQMGQSVEVYLSTYVHVVDRDAADKRLRAALSG